MRRRNVCLERLALVIAGAIFLGCGCSGKPGRIRPPDVDPESAAGAAFQQLDTDADGQLDDEELTNAPGLASVKKAYDGNGDGTLAQDEVAAGIRRWAEGESGAIAVAYLVQLNGRALPEAEVKAIPEPFLGDAVKPAAGADGYLGVAPEDRPANAPNLPLVLPGLYRIEITHPSIAIPAKYNTKTTLGLEVSSAMRSDQAVVWALSGK
jgi:hypothetical protein